MAVSSIVIKVKYGNTFRRFRATVYDDVRLEYLMEDLRRKVLGLFNLSPNSDVTLKYTDEDGDLVTLVNDDELQDVRKQRLNPFMIYVTLNNKKKSAGHQPQPKLLPGPFHEAVSKMTLGDANVSFFASYLREFAELLSKMGVSKQIGNKCEDDSEQNGDQSEDDSEQNNDQSEDDFEKNSGRSEDYSEKNTGHYEDYSEQNSGQFEYNSEQNSDPSEDDSEQNSDQSEDDSEEISGQSEDDTEQNSVQFESDSEEHGDEKNDSINNYLSKIIRYMPMLSGKGYFNQPNKKYYEHFVHRGVRCFGCGCDPIVGPRFKRIIHANHNLCRMCFSEIKFSYYEYIEINGPTFLHHPDVQYQGLKLDSSFISVGNVFDGRVLAPSTSFCKTWRMCNCGTVTWPQGTKLVRNGGETMRSVDIKVPVSGVHVGEEFLVTLQFVTPKQTGRHTASWRMALPSGELFGEQVCMYIHVDTNLDVPYKSTDEEDEVIVMKKGAAIASM